MEVNVKFVNFEYDDDGCLNQDVITLEVTDNKTLYEAVLAAAASYSDHCVLEFWNDGRLCQSVTIPFDDDVPVNTYFSELEMS